jgi:type I restriction-modification system DNA methylase subunit
MKLSDNTLTLLKNFATINQGIMFKKGKTLRTVSSQKNVMAEATINEEIPTDFGVYDLNNFLSVLSLHKDDPVLDFQDNNVLISGLQGRS